MGPSGHGQFSKMCGKLELTPATAEQNQSVTNTTSDPHDFGTKKVLRSLQTPIERSVFVEGRRAFSSEPDNKTEEALKPLMSQTAHWKVAS